MSVRLLAAVVATAAAGALAHGVLPRVTSVQPRGQASTFLVGTTFGALLTDDDAASLWWVCEEAIGLDPTLPASWAVGPGGGLLAGSLEGLRVSRDQGCTWAPVELFAPRGVAALAPAGPAVLAATGRAGADNGVWRSLDEGQTWGRVVAERPGDYFTALRPAPGDAQRVYATSWQLTPLAAVLWRSDDGGQTFTATDVSSQLPGLGPFTALAVHPTQGDVLYATVAGQGSPARSWLLRSEDGGRTFEVVLERPYPFTHATVAADGEVTALTGGVSYRSADGRAPYRSLSAPIATCLQDVAGQAVRCVDPDDAGVAATRAEAPWLRWGAFAGVAACPEGTPVQQQCPAVVDVQRAELGLPVEAPDPGPPPPCGCGATPGGLLLLGLLPALRRRRPARPGAGSPA